MAKILIFKQKSIKICSKAINDSNKLNTKAFYIQIICQKYALNVKEI